MNTVNINTMIGWMEGCGDLEVYMCGRSEGRANITISGDGGIA